MLYLRYPINTPRQRDGRRQCWPETQTPRLPPLHKADNNTGTKNHYKEPRYQLTHILITIKGLIFFISTV
ncbi:hypothetical protein QCA50_018622 [Cerrena zonata]|uniref:Uncharacterized protein n=1 Tax=Cerrena zonata TaxID=2478898 RepID=A0AAW0FM62_9APHY